MGCPPSCLGLLYDHLCQLGAVPAAHLSHGCALQEIPAKDAPCQQPHGAVVAKDGVKGTGGEGNGGEKRGQRRRLLAPQTGIPIAEPCASAVPTSRGGTKGAPPRCRGAGGVVLWPPPAQRVEKRPEELPLAAGAELWMSGEGNASVSRLALAPRPRGALCRALRIPRFDPNSARGGKRPRWLLGELALSGAGAWRGHSSSPHR